MLYAVPDDDHVEVAGCDPGSARLEHAPRARLLDADRDSADSRSASSRVNIGGMCCTITMGTGKSAGSRAKISAKAFGPPVEVPMATTWTGPVRRRRPAPKRAGPGACLR